MKHIIIVTITWILLLVLSLPATAQVPPADRRKKELADNFVTAYNAKDYKQMRKRFSLLMKIFATRKMMREMFEYRYDKFGRLVLQDGDIKISGNKASVYMSYANDPTQKEILSLNFSRKNKVIGMFLQPRMFTFAKPAHTVTNYEAEIDSIMADNFPRGFNGAVTYTSGSEVLFRKCYGYTSLPGGTPLNDSSMFELASCSKQFTAAAILKLQEQGKLTVDDSLRAFFPQLPYQGVTIRHLLCHTGGLPDYMTLLMSKKVKKDFCYNDDVIDVLATKQPKRVFAPGDRYQYSNTGYALLASIIEKASGMSYADYLAQSFFKPLGMTHTRVYNTRRTRGEVLSNYAYGYVYHKKEDRFYLPDSLKQTRSYVSKLDGIVGDGTVNISIADLDKWDAGLTHHTVLSAASIDSANTPGRLNNGSVTKYGYGVMIDSNDTAGRIIWHTGGWPGYQTIICRFVDRGEMLVILSSKDYPQNELSRATNKIASLYLVQ